MRQRFQNSAPFHFGNTLARGQGTAGAAAAALNSSLSTGGGTDDTSRLQGLFNRASNAALSAILDGPALISSELSLYGNTELVVNAGGGLYVAAGTNAAALRNHNLVATGLGQIVDQNIRVVGLTLNGNGANQLHDVGAGAANQWTFGMRFHGVAGLTIERVHILQSRTFAFEGSNLDGFLIRDVVIDNDVGTVNTDGVHINGPARRGRIENITVATGDDGVALMADDGTTSPYVAGGDITDILIDGICCKGALSALRLGSDTHILDRVRIRNITGSVTLYGGIMNAVNPALATGVFGDWSIHGVNLDMPSDAVNGAWEISATHKVITFGDITRRETACQRFYWHICPAGTVRQFNIEGFHSYENGAANASDCQMYIEGAVGVLNLSDITWENSTATATAAAFIKFGAGGSIGKLIVGAGVDVPLLFAAADAGKIGQIIGDYPKLLWSGSFTGLNGTTAANYTPERGAKGSMLTGAGTLTANTLAIPNNANPLYAIALGAVTPNLLLTTYFTFSANQGQVWFTSDPTSTNNGIVTSLLTTGPQIGSLIGGAFTLIATLPMALTVATVHKLTYRAEKGTLTLTIDDTNTVSVAIPAALLAINGVFLGNAGADATFQKTTIQKI